MKHHTFNYSDREGAHSIPFKEIVRFCAEANYVGIFLASGKKVLVSMELCEAEEKLVPPHPFIRIQPEPSHKF